MKKILNQFIPPNSRNYVQKLFILSLLINIFLARQCSVDDYKMRLYPCEKDSQTRNISFYLISDCNTDAEVSESDPIFPYYTLPVYNVSCLLCGEGEIIKYNMTSKDVYCEKCSGNTYSSGRDIKFLDNWSTKILKENFIINCFSIGSFLSEKNQGCTGMSISEDGSYIQSGHLLQGYKYLIQFIVPIKSEFPGRIVLKYKYDFTIVEGYYNGRMNIFFDYQVLEDVRENPNEYKILFHDFSPGTHELAILFNYYNKGQVPLRFYIQSLEILNVKDSQTMCMTCENSVTNDEKTKCIACPDNHYFNKEKMTCIKCAEDEMYLPGFSPFNTCNKKMPCTKYDRAISDVGKCDEGSLTKKIIFENISKEYCIIEQNNSNSSLFKNEEIVSCNIPQSPEEEKCKPGYVYSNYYNLDLLNIPINKFFDKISGWFSNGEEIFPGIYTQVGNENILIKKIPISENGGYISFGLNNSISKNEEFSILLNNKPYNHFLNNIESGIKNIRINLEPGENIIEFNYKKKDLIQNPKISISIRNITIVGSTENTEQKILISCGQSKISSQDCKECISCNPNKEKIDKVNNKCIKLGEDNQGNETEKEKERGDCPAFTSDINNDCILNEVLYIPEETLKINLAPLKDYQYYLCEEMGGYLCYEDNLFIGPIIRNSESEYNSIGYLRDLQESSDTYQYTDPLFFMSLFKESPLELTDYLYTENESDEKKDNSEKKGHIFALFSKELKNDNNNNENNLFDNSSKDGIFNMNPLKVPIITETNTQNIKNKKIKKTIAERIKNVYLIGKSLNVRFKSGVLIEYDEGETCIYNKEKKFKAYVYLKCMKNDFSFPKLVDIKEDKCTYIFEWDSPYSCKNCLTKELTHYEVSKCTKGIRQYLFESNEECLIFDISNKQLSGKDQSFNVKSIDFGNPVLTSLFEKTNRLRELDFNEPKFISVEKQQQLRKFKFEYIENEIYQEKCYFFEDFSLRVKIIIIVVICIYLTIMVIVLVYFCKYRSIRNKYERIRNIKNSTISHDRNDRRNNDIVSLESK